MAERTMLYGGPKESTLRLSRQERDHIAGHALDSIGQRAREVTDFSNEKSILGPPNRGDLRRASDAARQVAALSNLLGDIGWGCKAAQDGGTGMPVPSWFLGELFPVAQLRPWLEEWQRQDNEALHTAVSILEVAKLAVNSCEAEPEAAMAVSDAQTKLGTGAILLARIEKWMASHEN